MEEMGGKSDQVYEEYIKAEEGKSFRKP